MKKEKSRFVKLFGITIGERGPRSTLALQFMQFDDHPALQIGILVWGIFLRMPPHWHRIPDSDEMIRSWGFSWSWNKYELGRTLWLYWGRKRTKMVEMPWSWKHIKTLVMLKNGEWVRKYTKLGDRNIWVKKEEFHTESYPYSYTLHGGKKQQATATITLSESHCKWRWFLPRPYRARRYININFDKEMGEGAGSWKGGVLGCSYDMRPNESPLDTLRRMEQERKFSR